MLQNLNFLDYIFIIFTAIFVLTAFFRGFIKEVFSLLNWVVAITLAHFLAPYAEEFLQRYFSNKTLIDVASRAIIFLLAFIITIFSTSNLRDALKEKISTLFDRSLGVLFGLAKTLLIFGLIYSLYFNLLKNSKEFPSWLKEAQCYSLLKISGETIDPLVKNFLKDATKHIEKKSEPKKELDQKIDEILGKKEDKKIAEKEVVKTDSSEIKKPSDDNSGYSKKDIEKMNRLIEIVQ